MEFEQINRGYNDTFRFGKLSIGLVVPIENYPNGPVPTMDQHVQRVRLVDELGYKALWVRDIPLNVPSFGDAGQTFDPFTYLGFLAGQTTQITLGIASVALPLHHPLHIAKSAATIDQLSGGRFILGVASGDRPEEYPAMGIDFDKRGDLFAQAFQYIRGIEASYPSFETAKFGRLSGMQDMLPKPHGRRIPMLVTGSSRQSLFWNAEYGDGWMNYPRNLLQQKSNIEEWRNLIPESFGFSKPFMQPLYIILDHNDDFAPQPIPLGFRIGIHHMIEYFHHLKDIGVNHLALNLRFNNRDMAETLEQIASRVLPQFHS